MSVIIGSASRENKNFNYFEEKISNAKKNILKFPTINGIVKNFNGATKKNSENNVFLNLSSVAHSDKEANDELIKFENVLKKLIPKISSNKLKDFKKRLRTLEEKNHFEKIIELWFYRSLSENKKIKEINYEDFSKGDHDFNLLLLDNTELNIEVTSLGKSKFEQKVEKGLNQACEKILDDLGEERIYLQITIDLEKVPRKNEDTSENISKFILHHYNKLKEIIFVEKKGLCRISDFKDSKRNLWELRDIFHHYHEFGQRLLEISKTSAGEKLLKNTTNSDLINSSFKSFIISPAKSQFVTIHSECASWTYAEKLRENSLLRQLKNSIRRKITKGQLKNKKNPFLAVYFEDIAFMNYWDREAPFTNFDELKGNIQKVFYETNEKEILGALLFYKNLEKSRFVVNPNSQSPITIINKIDSEIIKSKK